MDEKEFRKLKKIIVSPKLKELDFVPKCIKCKKYLEPVSPNGNLYAIFKCPNCGEEVRINCEIFLKDFEALLIDEF